MKAKWGALVVDGRGKIGGHVASKNRSGGYFRTKVTPVNPRTADQSLVRNRLTAISQAWRGLTAAQRSAWNAAVASFAKTNVFGDLVNPTGFNLYQRLNNNLVAVSQAQITSPPTPEAVDDIVIGALTVTAATDTVSLAYTPGAGGSSVKVFATPPQSPGKSFVKSEYRYIGSFESDDVSPTDLGAVYTGKFGSLTSAAGQKVFVKTVAINQTTGQAGVAQSTSAIVG